MMKSGKTASADSPGFASFIILLIILVVLNIADMFQTIYLKESGFLGMEANYFIDFFLKEGRLPFFGAKLLALVLICSILLRGWFDNRGIKFGSMNYSREQVRQAIYFMLVVGNIYYIIIVGFPFFAMLVSGMITPPAEAAGFN